MQQQSSALIDTEMVKSLHVRITDASRIYMQLNYGFNC